MPTATLTSKGQITIPKEVRDKLGLTTGSKVTFVLTGDDQYQFVAKRRSIMDLKGMAKSDAYLSVEAMDELIGQAALEANQP